MQQIPRRTSHPLLWLVLAILTLGVFLGITTELFEGRAAQIDRAVLLEIAQVRAPGLTVFAIGVTALGSTKVLATIVAIALLGLLTFHRYQNGSPGARYESKERRGRNQKEILQLLIAATGAGLLAAATKSIIERPRPEVIPRLIEVTGSSYPSGHSLGATAIYLTIAILIAGRLRRLWTRIAILAMSVCIALLVALSRLYLGVHYPSDAAAGVTLGMAWAFLVAGGFAV